MSKETTEFSVFVGKTINAIAHAAEDGKLDLIDDIPKFVNPLLAAQPGISGFNLIDDEAAVMTNEGKEDVLGAFDSELVRLDPEVRSDITGIYGGLLSGVRLGFRKGREQGIKEARAELVRQLRAEEITVEQLLAEG